MTLANLTEFFKWMTIINVGIFAFWSFWILLAPDLTYKIQNKFIKIDRDYFEKVMYAFLGAAKLIILFFCITPYIALLIIA